MSEIFISYASQDRETAKALAQFLEQRSCSVFWDRTIPPGKSWDDILEQALREARVVVVLWSKAAVASDWVKAEAAEAAARGILVPAMIEKTELPLRFRAIQAADLTTWNWTGTTGEIRALLGSVAGLVGRKLPDGDIAAETPAFADGTAGNRTPIPSMPDPRGASHAVFKALAFHLLLGIGLFRIDPSLKRKWIYVAVAVYALVDVVLATMRVDPFRGTFGGATFLVAAVIYCFSFIDIGLTQYRRWKTENAA